MLAKTDAGFTRAIKREASMTGMSFTTKSRSGANLLCTRLGVLRRRRNISTRRKLMESLACLEDRLRERGKTDIYLYMRV